MSVGVWEIQRTPMPLYIHSMTKINPNHSKNQKNQADQNLTRPQQGLMDVEHLEFSYTLANSLVLPSKT